MIKVNHNCTCEGNPLVPQMCKVIKITNETPDIKTFRMQTLNGERPFNPGPGQLGFYAIPGYGEAIFSITAVGDNWIESAVKKVGHLTEAMHELSEGDLMGLRGPYGNGFPMDELKGNDVLFIGGGVGAAPVRSVIRRALEERDDYGKIDIVCGFRSPDDIPFKDDYFENWPKVRDCDVHLTIDRPAEGWDKSVAFVPDFVEKLGFTSEGRRVVLCGPGIMMKLTSAKLIKMGFDPSDIICTMETRMKCGIGKCGRCNIGSKFICLDGPVFTLEELGQLPDEN